MALSKTQQEKLEKQSFEQCLADLDELVQEMESGNVPLEEMIRKFETGSAIAAVCHKKLASLKQQIEILQNPAAQTAVSEKSERTPAPRRKSSSGGKESIPLFPEEIQ